MTAPVRHATQTWVDDAIEEALKGYTPGPGGGSGDGGASSPVLTSPNGTRYRQVVDDAGKVTAVQTLEPGPPAVPANVVLHDPDAVAPSDPPADPAPADPGGSDPGEIS